MLVQQLRVAAVDDRLAAEARADPPRRVLEVDQPLGAGQLEVERARRAVPERARCPRSATSRPSASSAGDTARCRILRGGWRAAPSEQASAEQPAALSAATLCEAFQITAAERPDAVALRTPGDGVSITWKEYAERVPRIAAGLASLGVQRGDTIALMLVNRPEFNVADAGALHLGATAFSVYNTSTPEQVAFLFGNAGNRVVDHRAAVPAGGARGAGRARPRSSTSC